MFQALKIYKKFQVKNIFCNVFTRNSKRTPQSGAFELLAPNSFFKIRAKPNATASKQQHLLYNLPSVSVRITLSYKNYIINHYHCYDFRYLLALNLRWISARYLPSFDLIEFRIRDVNIEREIRHPNSKFCRAFISSILDRNSGIYRSSNFGPVHVY